MTETVSVPSVIQPGISLLPFPVFPDIPFIEGSTGLLNLGPQNGSAVIRLANYAQALIKSGQPIPDSSFCEWAAGRVTGDDRQDLVIFIQGRRGSGKSYSALWLGYRLGLAIAKRKGGTWQDYFSLKNSATLEDAEKVMEILSNAGKYQVVLVDDCSLAISNRAWNSPQNRNFNALLSIARTNRWILLLTAPLKAHVDNQVREMCDINIGVYKSFHAGGFNILKIHSSDIGARGKEYNRRLSFSRKKVDMWVSFRPPLELTREYDKARDESALALNKRIVETGSYKNPGTTITTEKKKSASERNLEDQIERYGPAIREYLSENKDATINAIAGSCALSHQGTARLLGAMKIKLKPQSRAIKKK